MAFFGLKYGQDFENLAAHPHQELPGVPPGFQGAVLSGYFYCCEYLTEEITATLDIQCETPSLLACFSQSSDANVS